MRAAFTTFRTWTPGLLTALVGVACVRLAAPHVVGRGQAMLFITGYLLVPVGLGLIARKIRCHAMTKSSGP